jgi:hypothetical protein
MKRTFTLLLASCAILSGCNVERSLNEEDKPAPKMIVADQTTYVACHGEVAIYTNSSSGVTTYDVKFTQADKTEMDVRGIKRLEISDVPATVPSSLPLSPPDPKTGTDKDGKPYVEGLIYTWPDGSQGMVKNGTWKTVPRRNTVCDATQP